MQLVPASRRAAAEDAQGLKGVTDSAAFSAESRERNPRRRRMQRGNILERKRNIENL